MREKYLNKENDRLYRLESKDYIETDYHLMVKESLLLDWPLHWHDYFEIEIIIDGSGQYLLDETTYDASQYNAFFLTPINFHQLLFDSPTKLINISFDETMLSESHLSIITNPHMEHAFNLNEEELKRIQAAATLLLHEYKIKGNCQKQLFEYILECLFRNSITDISNHRSESLAGIEKAFLYMEMHFREKITLTTLAEQAGLHPNYFSTLFRQATGKTYIEKLNQLRINYACALLRKGFSVSDACFSSGFNSLSNFLSIFKARRGISPSEYKQRHIAQKDNATK